MPTVAFEGARIDCAEGAILRDVLRAAGHSPYNGRAETLNCRGLGSCGTCAVAITARGDGGPPVSEPTLRECARLSFPPHSPEDGLRLACQTRVYGDVIVEKYPGFWGHKVDE
ncbi:Ferredoxin [Halogranum gelatinilyticum]|uniref:Ferredoxin n=1 Tax=Halogranum gelatinilyticum TaxID=660521 RepID=A0A1G9RFQ7_9EURY|nr:2Fe-2S iron-sulfur cluster-binding protein [Halogranum gelatinilyticum]SDM22001.1 Ferredoxin [Halogranum gelatinilyticum]